ncbi:hypothetical protein [Rhizobium sp. BK251]|uniref:hypothetical protein n=1 Tax=Rhizobium sp. BK251 TaxID=2512125 RepID=UPI0010504D6A|nr:hypothetical protein [Rhizobium sp. BK251]TCL71941.1 hypothetical protein EV286_105199 [Rhizobium sp. BK251]
MYPLERSEVWRGGITASEATLEHQGKVFISSYEQSHFHGPNGGIKLTFEIATEDGGSGHVMMCFDSEDFHSFAKYMLEADRVAARKAFAAAELADPE